MAHGRDAIVSKLAVVTENSVLSSEQYTFKLSKEPPVKRGHNCIYIEEELHDMSVLIHSVFRFRLR